MFSELEKDLSSFDIKDIKKEVYFRNDGFDFSLIKRGFEMSRKVTYGKNGNIIYHELLRVPKGKQGLGLTRLIFQKLFKQYEAGSITRINVSANIDVGGYAWARYGFSATNKKEVLEIINNSKNKEFKKKAKQKIRYHYGRYGDNKPFPMIRLTTIKYGKDALLNTWWSGTINLSNKKELKVFLKYLNR